jgi:hypothetical protein
MLQNSITALAPLMCVAIYVCLKSAVSAWRALRWRVQQQSPNGSLRLRIARALRRV